MSIIINYYTCNRLYCPDHDRIVADRQRRRYGRRFWRRCQPDPVRQYRRIDIFEQGHNRRGHCLHDHVIVAWHILRAINPVAQL